MADENQATETQRQAPLSGRRMIVCSESKIDKANVVDVIGRTEAACAVNSYECERLHGYFLGRQPVLNREKAVRSEINNPVVENRAYEIVKWKTGNLVGEPISYSARASAKAPEPELGQSDARVRADADTSHWVQQLNDECIRAGKHRADVEIAQWAYICGLGYRLVLPGDMHGDGPRFKITALDPRSTFVVYDNTPFHEPLYAMTWVKDEVTGQRRTRVYTKDRFFEWDGGDNRVVDAPNPLNMIPIIEYDANPERMGVFEPAITLLDAINETESNRVDGVAQFVQALMVFTNVDFDKSDLQEMLALGAVKIYSTEGNKASVELLTAQLDQQQTETLVSHLYKAVLSITGMPQNQGGGASTSDTGQAVALRDGWSSAESRAKETEGMFKDAERRFLKAALLCMSVADKGFNLTEEQVEVKFTRRNYEAIQSKTQVLTTMLGSDKIDPRLAFIHSGMFSDPEAAYDASRAYVEERERKAREIASAAQKTVTPAQGGGNGDAGDGAPVANDNGDGDATPVNKA